MMTLPTKGNLFSIDCCHLFVESIKVSINCTYMFKVVNLKIFTGPTAGADIVEKINRPKLSIYYS